MKKTEEFENCAELAKTAESEPKKKRFERMADGWKTVAKTRLGSMAKTDNRTRRAENTTG